MKTYILITAEDDQGNTATAALGVELSWLPVQPQDVEAVKAGFHPATLRALTVMSDPLRPAMVVVMPTPDRAILRALQIDTGPTLDAIANRLEGMPRRHLGETDEAFRSRLMALYAPK